MHKHMQANTFFDDRLNWDKDCGIKFNIVIIR